MNQDEYIKTRVDDQLKWYGKKSGINTTYYYFLKALIIILSVIITLMAGIKELNSHIANNYIFITSLLGALIAILTALSSLWKFQDKWISYRLTSENLKKEKFLFLTASKPYEEQNAFSLFVNRIETLLATEKQEWSDVVNDDVDA